LRSARRYPDLSVALVSDYSEQLPEACDEFTVVAKPLTQTVLAGAICRPLAEHACPRIDLAKGVQTDWQAWCSRALAAEDVVRLILDGTVARVRLDRKATSISLVVLGIRRDDQKVLLAVPTYSITSGALMFGRSF
jgi:hypothetical protein